MLPRWGHMMNQQTLTGPADWLLWVLHLAEDKRIGPCRGEGRPICCAMAGGRSGCG